MSDQFMQEIQEESSALEELERRVSEASGGNVAVEAADEMIRANGEAQAIEVETLKETVRAYQQQIDELKALYARNSALVESMRQMNVETTKGVQDVMKASADALSENSHALEGVDFARMQEELKGASEASGTRILESVAESQKKIEDLLQQSDDFAHKENVRVYRNVQAATEQLLTKQTEELKMQIDELKKPQKPKISWIQILILLLTAAAVVLEVLQIAGIF